MTTCLHMSVDTGPHMCMYIYIYSFMPVYVYMHMYTHARIHMLCICQNLGIQALPSSFSYSRSTKFTRHSTQNNNRCTGSGFRVKTKTRSFRMAQLTAPMLPPAILGPHLPPILELRLHGHLEPRRRLGSLSWWADGSRMAYSRSRV